MTFVAQPLVTSADVGLMAKLRELGWKALGSILILLGIGGVVATIESLRTSVLAGAILCAIAIGLLAGGGMLRSWSDELRCVRRAQAATKAGRAARREAATEAAGVVRMGYLHVHDEPGFDHTVLFDHVECEHGGGARSMSTSQLRSMHDEQHATSPAWVLAT
jgi:hypothetical protein